MGHDPEAYADAVPKLERLVQVHRLLGEETKLRDRLLDLGICALRSGRPVAARAAYEEAIVLSQRVGPHPQQAGALLNLGDARRESGDLRGGFAAYNDALVEARRVGGRRDEEAALKALAFVALEEGLLDEAIAGYHMLRDYYIATDQVAQAAQVTVALDLAEASRGSRLDAAELADAVDQGYDESSIAGVRVLAMWRAAFALRDEGRIEDALRLAEQAWAVAAQTDDQVLQASAANNVATLLSYAGDDVAARDTIDQALDLLRQRDAPARLVSSLCTKSSLEAILGNETAALDALAEASEISRDRLSGTPLEGEVLLALSKLSPGLDPAWLLSVRQRALELADRPGYDRLAVRAMLGLADAQARSDAAVSALKTLNSAVLRARSARIESDEHAALVARAKLLDRLARRDAAIQDLDAACATVERWRGAIEDEALRRAFFSDAVESHRVLACWHAQAGDLRAAFRHAEMSKTRTLLDAFAGGRSAIADLDDVQAALSASDAVLLEYVVPHAEPAIVLVVAPDRVSTASLGSRYDIVQVVRRLRAALEGDGDSAPAAHALYERLVAPVIAELSHRELWIAPDGPLDTVPFAMLAEREPERLTLTVDGKDEDVLAAYGAFLRTSARRRSWVELDPLVKRWPIRTIPSASVALRPRTTAGDVALIVAAPLDDETTAVDGFHPLRAAREEAETISVLWTGITTVQLLIGQRATKATLLEAATREALRLLHFAGHGLANDRNLALSALVLGPGHAGRLTAGEIGRQAIKADLVVLAACETGLGPSAEGEGTMSLARAFVLAGASQVALALWQVDDHPTADLMASFHKHVVDGDAPHDALQVAQLERLDLGPRVWAAFAVVG